MHGVVVATGETKTSHRVVEALATARDVDPLRLNPPLYEVVDVEALDRLVKTGVTRVTFTYEGHEVRVDGDGTVAVDGTVYVRGTQDGAS
jgi:hypothetical protein